LRSLGGTIYLVGVFFMVYNLVKTIKSGSLVANEAAEAAPLPKVITTHGKQHWHRWIERRPIQMLVFSLIAVAIGGAIEMMPTFLIKSNIPTIAAVKPYTPLELQGRDIYVREGCYLCHSQMIRPFRDEVARYGEYSKAGEFVYDHPFQWGSKRTGPDLAREGGRYPNLWHYRHMIDPRATSPGSIMPSYAHLASERVDLSSTAAKLRAMRMVGVPYTDAQIANAQSDARHAADAIVRDLRENGATAAPDSQLVALIAYLQRLGTDIKTSASAQAPAGQAGGGR